VGVGGRRVKRGVHGVIEEGSVGAHVLLLARLEPGQARAAERLADLLVELRGHRPSRVQVRLPFRLGLLLLVREPSQLARHGGLLLQLPLLVRLGARIQVEGDRLAAGRHAAPRGLARNGGQRQLTPRPKFVASTAMRRNEHANAAEHTPCEIRGATGWPIGWRT